MRPTRRAIAKQTLRAHYHCYRHRRMAIRANQKYDLQSVRNVARGKMNIGLGYYVCKIEAHTETTNFHTWRRW